MKVNTYFKNLDPLRFFAFLGVFFYHLPHDFSWTLINKIQDLGKNGVPFFFILSSFLITYIALQTEKDFNLKNFFKRRSLRIWPLYFFFLLLGFVLIPAIATFYHINLTLPPLLYYLFFINNQLPNDHVFYLVFLWTIALEEQFYLVWGILFFFFKKKALLLGLSLLSVQLVLHLIGLYTAKIDIIYHSHSLFYYFFEFGTGCLLAHFVHKRGLKYNKNTTRIVSLLLLLESIILLSFNFDNTPAIFLKILLICFFTQLIYINLFQHRFNLANIPFISYLGKISYGLYVYHGLVITLMFQFIKKIDLSFTALFIITLGITVFISSLSYQFLEKPFLKLKTRLKT